MASMHLQLPPHRLQPVGPGCISISIGVSEREGEREIGSGGNEQRVLLCMQVGARDKQAAAVAQLVREGAIRFFVGRGILGPALYV